MWEWMLEREILWLSWWKSTQEWERGDCSQGSSRYVSGYSRNSYSCSISPCVCFWILNKLLIGVDVKGHKLFCWDWSFTSLSYFDFVSLMSLEIYNSMPECDHALFSFKSYSALFLLFLAHGLILEVGGYLCLLINIFCSFLLRVLLRFFFYLFYIHFPTRCSNPCVCIWVYIGEWRNGMKCAEIPLKY